MTAEAAAIAEITIIQHTDQDRSVLGVLILHNSSHLFCVTSTQLNSQLKALLTTGSRMAKRNTVHKNNEIKKRL